MRALLIDPEKRTITETQISDDYRDIQAALRCDSLTTGSRPLRGDIEHCAHAAHPTCSLFIQRMVAIASRSRRRF